MVGHDRRARSARSASRCTGSSSRATTSSRRRGWASSRRSPRRVALSLALLPLWTVVGDWIFWVNGVTMTIAVRPDGRERHRLRDHRGARGRRARAGDAGMTRRRRGCRGARSGSPRAGWTIGGRPSRSPAAWSPPRSSRCPARPRVMRGGVVAYATDVKQSLLGVDADLLASAGAVDPEVARQMAEGIADRSLGGCGRRRRDDRRGRSRLRRTASPSARSTSPSSTPGRHRAIDVARRSPGSREQIRAETVDARSRSALEAAAERSDSGNRPCFSSVTFGDSHPFPSARD